MKPGYAKRKWWAFQEECEAWGGDCDVLAFIEWLYEKGYEIMKTRKLSTLRERCALGELLFGKKEHQKQMKRIEKSGK